MELSDVTLREGDQMPGRSYDVEQKVAAGKTLDELGLGYIQAGFPITGETDRDAIRQLSTAVEADVIGLARSTQRDVDAALEADADVIEVFISISDKQLEHVLGMNRETALTALTEAVDRGRDGGATVHVTLADAFRATTDDIREVAQTLPDVEYLTLADTVGARVPTSVRSYLQDLADTVDLDRVGVHFHDNLGVATANVLAAFDVGVARADVSIAALGERAGNPALEEVVAAGATEYDDAFGVDESRLIPNCHDVLDTLGEDVDPRKAVLGTEVCEHESGIHTTAMLDEPSVFEPFNPKRFGGERRLLFGANTGRTGAKKLLERAGVEPTEERVTDFLERLAEDGDLETEEAVALATSMFET